MASVSPIFKGVEILPDGIYRYSSFQEAHDASKASIQSRISNLESGGVKDTGKGSTVSEVKKFVDKG
ncbi:DNA/RNA non-specific endonuclease, partial [Bacillus sp. D-CC]